MPASIEIIDDNTLYLLLALALNGSITIPKLSAVYDNSVNYDYTAIKPNNDIIPLSEIANAGIDYIVENYGVAKNDNDGKITLSASNSEHIKNFLNEYLKNFPHNTSEYYTEEKHINQFYSFIETESPEVLEIYGDEDLIFEGKYFTYKYLPKDNKEKYKMVEYIAKLLMCGDLTLRGNKPFDFYNENGESKKTINIGFTNKNRMKKLFLKFYHKAEQQKILKDLENEKPEYQSKHWIVYKNEIVYIQNPSKPDEKIVGTLRNKFKELLIFCIKKGNAKSITPKEFAEYNNKQNKRKISIDSAKKYFSEIHVDIEKIFQKKIKVLNYMKSTKTWQIEV